MEKRLTQKQEAILVFIKNYEAENKIRPTLSQIQRHFGMASLESARQYVRALVKKGAVVWPKKYIVAAQAASGGSLGAAWVPFITDDSLPAAPESAISLETHLLVDGRMFPDATGLSAFKVKDDRMIDVGINEGDVVIVRRRPNPPNGKVVLIRHNGSLLLQRLLRGAGGKHTLRSENTAYRDMAVTAKDIFSVEGDVVGLLRSSF